MHRLWNFIFHLKQLLSSIAVWTFMPHFISEVMGEMMGWWHMGLPLFHLSWEWTQLDKTMFAGLWSYKAIDHSGITSSRIPEASDSPLICFALVPSSSSWFPWHPGGEPPLLVGWEAEQRGDCRGPISRPLWIFTCTRGSHMGNLPTWPARPLSYLTFPVWISYILGKVVKSITYLTLVCLKTTYRLGAKNKRKAELPVMFRLSTKRNNEDLVEFCRKSKHHRHSLHFQKRQTTSQTETITSCGSTGLRLQLTDKEDEGAKDGSREYELLEQNTICTFKLRQQITRKLFQNVYEEEFGNYGWCNRGTNKIQDCRTRFEYVVVMNLLSRYCNCC